MTRPTFLVIAGLASSLINFRGHLLAEIVHRGFDVHAAAPDLDKDGSTRAALEAMGVVCHNVAFERTGTNPFRDLGGIIALFRLMRRLNCHGVLAYTIKPVVYGMLAAAAARVPKRFALITGLGYAFTGEAKGVRARLQKLVRFLYRVSLGRADKIFFQNPDDAGLFAELGLAPQSTSIVVVNGSGVDLEQFEVEPLPDPPIRFLLIARLLGDKGIREYAAAAASIRMHHPKVECHLVGGADSNPDAIPLQEIDAWQQCGALTWHGQRQDVRPYIASTHVYVLPSYREGTPRTVLEAMSMGRPIITTDAPGCRETVVPEENGFLVPVRDSAELTAAMERFIAEPDLVARMGRRSREIAEQKYDVHRVNSVMIDEMGL